MYDLEKSPRKKHTASKSFDNIMIRELDENGMVLQTFSTANLKDDFDTSQQQSSSSLSVPNLGFPVSNSTGSALLNRSARSESVLYVNKHGAFELFSEIFLPTGYPYSVKSDYIYYQIYDSLQAFSSSIASLFANRAVLSAVGVGDDKATSTSALFMKIIQDTVGRMGTVVFAWKFGSTLEPECKKFRFAADLVNDAAMLFECFSPWFPFSKPLTISMLCMSGLLKSICGVMAGGSRAALTLHFTQPDRGSVADVNAKDQSQETVISLMGTIAGSLVVGIVTGEGPFMWSVLLTLIFIHLYTNYQAVRSVIMTTMNRQRTNLIFSEIMGPIEQMRVQDNSVASTTPKDVFRLIPSPLKVAQRERILEFDGVIRNLAGNIIGKGIFTEFKAIKQDLIQAKAISSVSRLVNITKDLGYVISFTIQKNRLPLVSICLISDMEPLRAKSPVQSSFQSSQSSGGQKKFTHPDLTAWVHAYLICLHLYADQPSVDNNNSNKSANRPYSHTPSPSMHEKDLNELTDLLISVVEKTAETLKYMFDDLDMSSALREAGWDIVDQTIQTYPVKKIQVEMF